MSAITDPVNVPDSIPIRETEFGVRVSVGQTVSVYSFANLEHDFGGAQLIAMFTTAQFKQREADEFKALLMKMHGRKRAFRYNPRNIAEPKGTANGSPSVDSVNSAKDELTTSGWDADQSDLVQAGDWIEATSSEEMRMVVEDATSDSSGNATLVVAPPFRSDVTGENLRTEDPGTNWRLTENNPQWSRRVMTEQGIIMDCVEDIKT